WIGINQIDARERGRRQPFEQKHGVVEVQPDIGEIFQVDRRERLGHAVDERLDPDEAGARMLFGLRDHVLAAAQSDLEAGGGGRMGAGGGGWRPDWGIGAPGRAARAWQARWQAAATGCRTAPPGAAAAHDPCGARKRRCAELCCGRIWTWRSQPPPCWTPYAPASTGLGHRGSDVLHQIGCRPGETAVLVWCSAEMAVSGGAAIDRPVELERAADVDRREPEDFG